MPNLNIEEFLVSKHEDLIVVNKPAGWPTTGRSLSDDDCIQFYLIEYFGRMVWAVHQLDADTSGLCLFALSKSLVSELKALWVDPGMVKEYYAFVHGEPSWNDLHEFSPIGSVGVGCYGIHPDGKSAHTYFEVIECSNGYSLLRARLYTGRTHQIRIHLSHLGHPLVGEEWYRKPSCRLHPRQALHAYRLSFQTSEVLPVTSFIAPVTADLVKLADDLGFRTKLDRN